MLTGFEKQGRKNMHLGTVNIESNQIWLLFFISSVPSKTVLNIANDLALQ